MKNTGDRPKVNQKSSNHDLAIFSKRHRGTALVLGRAALFLSSAKVCFGFLL